MKITIEQVVEAGNNVASAIEAACKDHDSIASGVIGPSFATSGPGSGWSKQYDASDYAERALSGDYGASSYIDSSDGREATLDELEELDWSDESVIELVCPSLAEAMEYPDAYEAMIAALHLHDAETDPGPWNDLEERVDSQEKVQEIIDAKADAGADAYLWLHDSGDCILWPDEASSEDDDGSKAIKRWNLTLAEYRALKAAHADADLVDCFA
jgi:hypothetical protein